MLFDTWTGLARMLATGTIAYIALVLMLRISGKRTLSKLNAFDLVVTVALGSVLATVILSKSVPLAEGVAALALLIGLQYLITWMSVRVEWFSDVVKSEPTVVFSKGVYVQSEMRRQRLTEVEVLAAMRSSGHRDQESVGAVIIETDGSLSVLPN